MLKDKINKLIAAILQPWHQQRLADVTKTHLISPSPKYISQFIGIYPQSIKLGEELTDQNHIAAFGAKDSAEFSFWSWRNCGIACVKMILDTKKTASGSMMDLTRQGVELGGYILHENGMFVDRGWFHHALTKLLRKHHVPAKMKKWQSIYSVASDILNNKLVILSVLLPGRSFISLDGKFDLNSGGVVGGHLLLATGVKINRGEIEGVYAHDPRGLPQYQRNVWIPKHIFRRIFSGRTIVT